MAMGESCEPPIEVCLVMALRLQRQVEQPRRADGPWLGDWSRSFAGGDRSISILPWPCDAPCPLIHRDCCTVNSPLPLVNCSRGVSAVGRLKIGIEPLIQGKPSSRQVLLWLLAPRRPRSHPICYDVRHASHMVALFSLQEVTRGMPGLDASF